tara:strand:- start:112 stop:408 length:297 start_codon:yes stop_codon:yes gene_type:complete
MALVCEDKAVFGQWKLFDHVDFDDKRGILLENDREVPFSVLFSISQADATFSYLGLELGFGPIVAYHHVTEHFFDLEKAVQFLALVKGVHYKWRHFPL